MDTEVTACVSSTNAEDYDFVFKIVLLGDSAVGKSNLLLRFTKDEFNEQSETTIGVQFTSSVIRVGKKHIKVQIWDTAGQERYRAITPSYYRGAVGAVIVYDITNMASFLNVDIWMKELRDLSGPSTVLLLVGNKCDCSNRIVSTEQAVEFAKKNNLLFIETSARDAINVNAAFLKIVMEIYKSMTTVTTHAPSVVQEDVYSSADLLHPSSESIPSQKKCCLK